MEPSVSEGGERREEGEGQRKRRGERRGGSKTEERKEGKGEEVCTNSFPVWSVLHVQYKCKALKMLTTGGEGRRGREVEGEECKALKMLMTGEREELRKKEGGEGGRKEDANHRGLFPQKNKQNLQNSIGESRTNGHVVCGDRGRHVCYISSLPPFPLSLKLHVYTDFSI